MLIFTNFRFNIEIGKDVSKMVKTVRINRLNNGEKSIFAHVFKRK